jgi:hypothetical protein
VPRSVHQPTKRGLTLPPLGAQQVLQVQSLFTGRVLSEREPVGDGLRADPEHFSRFGPPAVSAIAPGPELSQQRPSSRVLVRGFHGARNYFFSVK